MAGIQEYTAAEALNRVLNTDEDALKVDIDNVTLKTEGSDINIEVHTDKAEDSMLMFSHTVKTGTGGTSYVPLVDSDGHLQVDTLSSALPTGAATAANQTTMITALQLLDNAVDGNYLNVNANIAGTDFVGGAGAVASGVQRVTLASDDPAVVDLAAMEVLLTGIDADTDAIKTDAAAIEVLITSTNSKIDTFDAVLDAIKVDTGTIDADTNAIKTATELIDDAVYADDADWTDGSSKHMLVGGLYGDNTITNGDVGPLSVDPSGVMYTKEFTGQEGAVYTTAASDAIKPPTGKAWVAIQMLEDTTFDSSGGLVAVSENVWFGTEHAAGDLAASSETTAEGSGGKQISNSVTFPQGMTIFGRWSEIDINSGSVIAYIGDY
jgi:hypothetical protein